MFWGFVQGLRQSCIKSKSIVIDYRWFVINTREKQCIVVFFTLNPTHLRITIHQLFCLNLSPNFSKQRYTIGPKKKEMFFSLSCLVTPGLWKDIQCHVWPCSSLSFQFTISDIPPLPPPPEGIYSVTQNLWKYAWLSWIVNERLVYAFPQGWWAPVVYAILFVYFHYANLQMYK